MCCCLNSFTMIGIGQTSVSTGDFFVFELPHCSETEKETGG